jgi:DNA-binding protein YbaB
MNGLSKCVAVRIDGAKLPPTATVTPKAAAVLEDLVRAAVNDALARSEAAQQEALAAAVPAVLSSMPDLAKWAKAVGAGGAGDGKLK